MKTGNYHITKSQAALILYLDAQRKEEPDNNCVFYAKELIKDMQANDFLIGEALDRLIDTASDERIPHDSEIWNIND